jgi:hypothetical protein
MAVTGGILNGETDGDELSTVVLRKLLGSSLIDFYEKPNASVLKFMAQRSHERYKPLLTNYHPQLIVKLGLEEL